MSERSGGSSRRPGTPAARRARPSAGTAGGGACRGRTPAGGGAAARATPAVKTSGRGASRARPRGGGGRTPDRGGGTEARRSRSGRLRGALRRVSPRAFVLLILLAIFVGFAFGPVMRNIEADSRLRKKEAELERQRQVTATLRAKVENAGSMQYVEEEARRQRMVMPGEVPYLVTSEGDDPEVRHRARNLQSMEEAWERVRLVLNSGRKKTAAEEEE